MKKIIIALMFINLCLPLFANENLPTFEEYFKQRIEEIKITPNNDRMEVVLRVGWKSRSVLGIKRQNIFPDYFEFKMINIYLFKDSNDFILFENKQHKFIEFINAAGGDAEKKLNSYFEFIEKEKKEKRLNIQELFATSYKENLEKFHQTSNSKFEEIVKAFNEQISSSEEARKRILDVYLKYSKKEENDSIRKEYDERFGRNNPILLYAFVGMALSEYSLRSAESQAGLRFNYYFSDYKSKFNAGLLFEIAYFSYKDIKYHKESIGVTRKYLNVNIGLSLKLYGKNPHSSFHFAIGFSSFIKIFKSDSYSSIHSTDTNTIYYKKYIPAISFNLEYLLIPKKSIFSLFVGLYSHIGLTKPYEEYTNGVKQEATILYSIGARLGLGFNLN